MVLRAVVSACEIGPGVVIRNRAVEEVQSDTVESVLTALLGVEVIERAPIVLVDVTVFDKHPLGGVRKLGLETLGNALGIELRVQHINETVIGFGSIKLDPIVGCQFDRSQLVVSFNKEASGGDRLVTSGEVRSLEGE